MNNSILAATDYPLHLLGWKAFQDISIAVAEECLRRPVQNFLSSEDAGRDGAFIGRWEGDDPSSGESTIQCKFTSKVKQNLSLSMLKEELVKASRLVSRGLANDYIIITNHPITGASEIKIKAAFQDVGVTSCRVFGYDWIVRQIKSSPRLRMMAPRLYGLGDLSDLLDDRAYAQAQLILSAMGDDLQKLVITEAHRKSVRAISAHNLVLLLGAPAAGKSTIGASLAIGAADIWQCETIKATTPEDIQRHLNPTLPQFFWIDDAWGNTQYQRQKTESWNQVFPLMQGAIKNGTRFLITSRDYIWRAAQRDLKLQALPALSQSQVIINVQDLSTQEKAQILYNHVKFGDQPFKFRSETKEHLPEVAEQKYFLPESARRFGSTFFSGNLQTSRHAVVDFFEKPEDFLLDTITNLAADCRAAIAVIFMNGGRILSPISPIILESAASAFGVSAGAVRDQIGSLNGSLLLLVQEEDGQYWAYKHPTVGDSFARYVAANPELVEIYLRGAKPESILNEVVCAGCSVWGAPVVIPDSMHVLLGERISGVEGHQLSSFLSYRSNKKFTEKMIIARPDILNRLSYFSIPIKDDIDASLVATLHEQGLLDEGIRSNFVGEVRRAACEDADASFVDDLSIESVLTQEERESILVEVESTVLKRASFHVERVKDEWDNDYSPDDHFDSLQNSLELFAKATSSQDNYQDILKSVGDEISSFVAEMNEEYEPASSTSAPTSSSTPQLTGLVNLFRDVDQ